MGLRVVGLGQVRVSGRLICGSARDVAIIRANLPAPMRLTRAEPGCLSFEVQQSDDPLIWCVNECFADQAAFEGHQARTRASEWWGATCHIRREYVVAGLG